jgi:hypothetical protein
MYSKEQSSKVKQHFWTTFGQYLKPVPGANGGAVNWLNYKTDNRHIAFRMDADTQKASITIEIKHPDAEQRMAYWQQFLLLKTLLENETGFTWQWQKEIKNTPHQTICCISQTMPQVNVLNQKDWPAIIAFLKPRMMGLDRFWELVKDGFE